MNVLSLPIKAMVDTGAQSTIISQKLLHEITRRLEAQQKPVPELEIPSVRLFGKECKGVKPEVDITAEVKLTLETDTKQATVPVLVQPNSEQPCLVGTNATTILGLKFLQPSGDPHD